MAVLDVEWANPIFYLNGAAFVASVFAFARLRKLAAAGEADTARAPVTGILALGTGLHLLGDLTGFPEDLDHVFIHAVVLAALLPLAWMLLRAPRTSA